MPGNINEPSPKGFIYSFTGNWASIISGGLSVPFTILSLYSNGSHGKLFFGLLAVFGIVLSSYKMLISLRYTDQDERHEWVTFCTFVYDSATKRFVIIKQWIEASAQAKEHAERPILTAL